MCLWGTSVCLRCVLYIIFPHLISQFPPILHTHTVIPYTDIPYTVIPYTHPQALCSPALPAPGMAAIVALNRWGAYVHICVY